MTKEEITRNCKEFLKLILEGINTNHPKFTCPAKFDWSARRVRCWGGPKGISIAMAPYFLPKCSEDNPQHFHEYARIRSRDDIGEFWYTDIMQGYKAIICHEVAHALCSYLYPSERIAHGEKWRNHYSQLRTVFVNPSIDLTLKGEKKDYLEEYGDCYIKNCHKYYLEPSWLGKTYMSGKHEMKIVGLSTRARKYPVKIIRLSDNKLFKTEAVNVRVGMTLNAK